MKYFRLRNYNPAIKNPYNIDSLSLSMIPKKSKVLEIGCGDGRLSEFIKQKLKCFLVTVDVEKHNADNSRDFADIIIVGNAENNQITKKISQHGPYDVVYASAIIGSIIDPIQFLSNIKKWLKKRGFLVITFPNILHLSNRWKFMFGKFDYSDSGLCAWEHLRFYTIKSAEKLVLDAGFKILRKDSDLLGFPRFERLLNFCTPRLFRFIYKIVPGLFTYQLVFKLQPNE